MNLIECFRETYHEINFSRSLSVVVIFFLSATGVGPRFYLACFGLQCVFTIVTLIRSVLILSLAPLFDCTLDLLKTCYLSSLSFENLT